MVELLTELSVGNCGDVGVKPSMGTDRMAVLICVAKVINTVLVVDAIPVIAIHEERRLGLVLIIEVNDLLVPDVRTVIVGDRNATTAGVNDAGDLRGSRWRRCSSIGGGAGVSGGTGRSACDSCGGRRPVEPIIEIVVRSRRTGVDPRDDRCPVTSDYINGRRPGGIDGSVVEVNIVLLSRRVGEEGR